MKEKIKTKAKKVKTMETIDINHIAGVYSKAFNEAPKYVVMTNELPNTGKYLVVTSSDENLKDPIRDYSNAEQDYIKEPPKKDVAYL